MINTPLVSIIIPIYNIEAFVGECIQSVVDQSYSNLEIILVDDGSIDGSGEVCDKYAATDSRIKVIHKHNGGLISARKSGLKAATGSYVVYVDGDDWIEKDLVSYYIKHALEFEADVVISSHMENLAGRIEVLTNTIPTGYYSKKDLLTQVYPKMLYNGKFSQFGIFSYVWGKLYKRSLLLENQLRVDEGIFIGEDAACLYPTLLDADSLVILDQPYYHYRQRVDSLIKTQKDVEIDKIATFYTYLKNAFDRKGFTEMMITQLQFFALSLLTVRSDGPPNCLTEKLYPFGKVSQGDRLIICGGGTFGQHLYKRLLKLENYKVVGWVDEWFDHYSKLGLPVDGFDKIKELEYDVIVVALIDEDISNYTVSKLLEVGVSRNKIIQVSHYGKKNASELLSEFDINT